MPAQAFSVTPNLKVFLTRAPLDSKPGLPDFTWYNIPKWENYSKKTTISENGHKIYKITVK
jgi:hypothetical protein